MIPSTEIEIDNTKYSLRFSAGTIIAVEKRIGKPISSLGTLDPNNVPIEILSFFFSEALRDIDNKKLQPSQIEEILDTIGVSELSKFVESGFNVAFPKEKKGGAKGN